MKLGFIGLGDQGAPIARRMIDAGHPMVLWARRQATLEPFLDSGAKIAPAVSFHELRHTYASLLAQAGADLLTISKLLGHADTRITARHYAHLCDKTLANTVDKLLPNFGFKPDEKVTDIHRAGR